MNKTAYREIIKHLMNVPNPTKKDTNLTKTKIANKYNLKKIPPNSELIRHLKPHEKTKLLPILRRKTVSIHSRDFQRFSFVARMERHRLCTHR